MSKVKRTAKEILQGKHANPSPLESAIELIAQAVALTKKSGMYEAPTARILRAAEVVVDSLDRHRDALEAAARVVAILEVKDDDLAAKAMPEAIQVFKLAAVRARLHQSLPRKPLEIAEGSHAPGGPRPS